MTDNNTPRSDQTDDDDAAIIALLEEFGLELVIPREGAESLTAYADRLIDECVAQTAHFQGILNEISLLQDDLIDIEAME